MDVLLTIAVLIVFVGWVSALYARVLRLRTRVKQAWQKLETDTSNVAVRNVYNKHVDLYNATLGSFPANILAALAGFKPARRFNP